MMKQREVDKLINLFAIIAAIYFIGMLFALIPARAEVTSTTASVPVNNDNLLLTPMPAPVGTISDMGTQMIYELADGTALIVNDNIYSGVEVYAQVHFARYEWQNAYWWVYDGGIIWGENNVGLEPQASSSVQVLSIVLYNLNKI